MQSSIVQAHSFQSKTRAMAILGPNYEQISQLPGYKMIFKKREVILASLKCLLRSKFIMEPQIPQEVSHSESDRGLMDLAGDTLIQWGLSL